MEKTVFIAGKNSAAGKKLAQSFNKRDVFVYRTSDVSEDKGDGCAELLWNRNSSVSARTVVLESSLKTSSINNAVLYFDEEYEAQLSSKMDVEECSRICDELVVSYEYLAMELLKKAEFQCGEGKERMNLVFMVKECPSLCDALKNPSVKNGIKSLSLPLVAGARALFETFAENFAAACIENTSVNVVLVKFDGSVEGASDDGEVGNWLNEYLNGLGENKKSGTKKNVQWVKAFSRGNSGSVFGLFRK